MRSTSICGATFALALWTPNILAHGGHGSRSPIAATPQERAAYEAAQPAFERHCQRCHTSFGSKSKRKAMEHLSIDTYPFGGHHASDAGRAVMGALGVGRKHKATMPKDDPGGVKGDDFRLIQAWADAFEQARRSDREGAGEHAH